VNYYIEYSKNNNSADEGSSPLHGLNHVSIGVLAIPIYSPYKITVQINISKVVFGYCYGGKDRYKPEYKC
jgi:hypothetical protein